jgi:hypothetical protein
MSQGLDDNDWNRLIKRIKEGKCTPFLGGDVRAGVLADPCMVARAWAKQHEYWQRDCDDLARVAQYLAVRDDPFTPKDLMADLCKAAAPPDFNSPDDPHGMLADLPLPVYVTTNYDDFLYQSLKSRRRDPRSEFCRWNKYVADDPSVFPGNPPYQPSPANPVVFHLHGSASNPSSLVLTEDDYLEFLMNVAKNAPLPKQIEKAIASTSIMFVGYRFSDWNFRVVFRTLVGYLAGRQMTHVCVQLVPHDVADEQEKVQEYFDKYFGNLQIRVFWGTSGEFVAEFRRRWIAAERPPAAAIV